MNNQFNPAGDFMPSINLSPQRHKGTEMFVHEPWSLFVGVLSLVGLKAEHSVACSRAISPLVPESSSGHQTERESPGVGDGQQGEDAEPGQRRACLLKVRRQTGVQAQACS